MTDGGQDRRRFQRYAVDLPALMRHADGGQCPVRIRDFCSGGLLLTHLQNQAGDCPLRARLRRGSDITVSVQVSFKGTERRIRLEGRVARMLDAGLGVSFSKPMPKILAVMKQYIIEQEREQFVEGGAPAPDSTPAAQSSASIETGIREVGRQYLSEAFAQMFDELLEFLLRQIEQADHYSHAQDLADVRLQLTNLRGQVDEYLTEPMIAEGLRAFRGEFRPAKETAEHNEFELSLLETDDFEDWLAASKITTSLADRLIDEIALLSARIRLVPDESGKSIKRDIPFHPLQLGSVLRGFLDQQGVHSRSRALVYQQAADSLRMPLLRLYTQLVEMLEVSGYKPHGRQIVRSDGAGTTDAAVASAIGKPRADEPASPEPAISAAEASAVNAAALGQATEAAANSNAPESSPSPTNAAVAQPVAAPASAAPVGNTPKVGMERQLAGQIGPLLQTFNAARLASQEPLLKRLSQVASHAGISFSPGPRSTDRINQVDSLVTQMREMVTDTPLLAETLDRLQGALIGNAMQDDRFFQDTTNPARQLIDQLARLGDLLDSEQPETQPVWQQVRQIIEALGQAPDNPALIAACEKITGFGDQYEQRFQHNVSRVAAVCEGQDRLRRVRQRACEAVNRQFVDRPVPSWFAELLSCGLLKALEMAMLQQRTDGGRKFKVLLGQLRQVTDAQSPDEKRVRWLTEIKADAIALSARPYEAEQLFAVAERQVGDGELEYRPFVALECGDDGDTLDFDELAAITDRQRWRELLQQVRQLRVGQRIRCHCDSGAMRELTLAWVSKQGDRLVLVDRRGVRSDSQSLERLAFRVYQGECDLHSGPLRGLTEQASDRLLEELQGHLRQQAEQDELTGLRGRVQFQQQVMARLSECSAGQPMLDKFLVWWNVDDFRTFNNLAGYDAGDGLLRSLADTLRACYPSDALLGHQGGDQFSAFLEKRERTLVQQELEGFQRALTVAPFVWQQSKVPVHASVGVVNLADVQTDSGIDYGSLVKAAEAAVQTAKRAGGRRICWFDKQDPELLKHWKSMEWAVKLNNTLANGSLDLRLQLIRPIEPEAGHRPHYEVLLGILDEQGERLDIAEFIAAAEVHQRMVDLDRWVARTAIEWASRHRDYLCEEFGGGLAINLSGQTMNDQGIASFVRELFQNNPLPADLISFEVTETVAIGNLRQASDIIKEIKSMGCHFALDDFGSGLSSFSYLRELPVDMLKIDGLFVKDLVNNPNDYAMVKSINEIGHFLGKPTIAEYVENDRILDCLRDIGVDFAQGWGIEKPRRMLELGE